MRRRRKYTKVMRDFVGETSGRLEKTSRGKW